MPRLIRSAHTKWVSTVCSPGLWKTCQIEDVENMSNLEKICSLWQVCSLHLLQRQWQRMKLTSSLFNPQRPTQDASFHISSGNVFSRHLEPTASAQGSHTRGKGKFCPDPRCQPPRPAEVRAGQSGGQSKVILWAVIHPRLLRSFQLAISVPMTHVDSHF